MKIPPKRIIEEFFLIYELKGAQRAVNYLTKYYGIRRMKLIVDGRRVGNGYEAEYFEGTATFTKRGFKKGNVLHELYHHLVYTCEWETDENKEEGHANHFAREILKTIRRN